MTVRDAIKEICHRESMTLQDVAGHSDMTQSNISHLISEKRNEGMDMRISTFLKILQTLDAELVIIDSNGHKYDLG